MGRTSLRERESQSRRRVEVGQRAGEGGGYEEVDQQRTTIGSSEHRELPGTDLVGDAVVM